jgi:hypothetical protein
VSPQLCRRQAPKGSTGPGSADDSDAHRGAVAARWPLLDVQNQTRRIPCGSLQPSPMTLRSSAANPIGSTRSSLRRRPCGRNQRDDDLPRPNQGLCLVRLPDLSVDDIKWCPNLDAAKRRAKTEVH